MLDNLNALIYLSPFSRMPKSQKKSRRSPPPSPGPSSSSPSSAKKSKRSVGPHSSVIFDPSLFHHWSGHSPNNLSYLDCRKPEDFGGPSSREEEIRRQREAAALFEEEFRRQKVGEVATKLRLSSNIVTSSLSQTGNSKRPRS